MVNGPKTLSRAQARLTTLVCGVGLYEGFQTLRFTGRYEDDRVYIESLIFEKYYHIGLF